MGRLGLPDTTGTGRRLLSFILFFFHFEKAFLFLLEFIGPALARCALFMVCL